MKNWNGTWESSKNKDEQHEAGRLHLEISKAHHRLQWQPRWDFHTTIERTVGWYKEVESGADPLRKSLSDISAYQDNNIPLRREQGMTDPKELKAEILRLTREYSQIVHSGFRPALDPKRKPWNQGDTIPYAGRVFTEDEVEAAVSTTLDFWLTLGQQGKRLQNELAEFLGVRHSILVNSGSSANLIAISTLTSPKLPRRKKNQTW